MISPGRAYRLWRECSTLYSRFPVNDIDSRHVESTILLRSTCQRSFCFQLACDSPSIRAFEGTTKPNLTYKLSDHHTDRASPPQQNRPPFPLPNTLTGTRPSRSLMLPRRCTFRAVASWPCFETLACNEDLLLKSSSPLQEIKC